jgi:pimeloyl-ACP methyl ester carboxylesterase
MSTLEQFQIEHDGIQVHGVVQGDGPPVLLVHGMPSSRHVWGLIKDDIATRYRVIAPDLPGFGQSTKVALPTLDAFAGWLARILDRVGEPSAHIVGHSFGGMLSLAFLHRFAPRVRSLVLCDSVGLGPYGGSEGQRRFAAARTREDVRAFLQTLFHDPGRISDALVEGQLVYVTQPGVPEVLEALISRREGWEAQVEARADAIDVPLMGIWGRNDRPVPVACADRLRRVPGARIVIIENCGHAPMVERAQEFGGHLLRFLDSVRGS